MDKYVLFSADADTKQAQNAAAARAGAEVGQAIRGGAKTVVNGAGYVARNAFSFVRSVVTGK